MRDPTHLYEGEPSPRARRLADVISFLTMPPFLSIPVFILISALADDVVHGMTCACVCILFATVGPISIIIYYAKKFDNKDVDIERREDRARPLIVGTISYLIGTVVLYAIDAPRLTWVLMLCYFVNTIAIFLISMKWKISVHAIGCVGPSMALAVGYGWVGGLFILILPVVAVCRYILRKHTPAQLVAGALLGFVLTGVLFIALL